MIWKPLAALALSLYLAAPARADSAAEQAAAASPPQVQGLGPGQGQGPGQVQGQVQVRSGRQEEVSVEAPFLPINEEAARRRWRRRWLATLGAGGGTLVVGAVLGGLALSQALELRAQPPGTGEARLLELETGARRLAFTADLMFGATALLGAITLVLRFGTGGSTPSTPADLEPAYQVP